MSRAAEQIEFFRSRRFRQYAEYKDSGVEWLGEIPSHWEVRRLRQILHLIEQGWSPDCENRRADGDEWGVLKAGCVNRGAFLESEHKALPSALSPIPALEIRKGDLLMSRASGSRNLVGSVAIVPECRFQLLLCDKVFRLHTEPAEHRRFLAHVMNSRAVRWQIESAISGGSGLASNIPQKEVKDLLIVNPPPSEGVKIGSYLDRETQKIDALVAKKEQLIELLQEKRTALITRAVTRGLDPNVPMKDSGFEWLSEIPAHWEVKRLKNVSAFVTSGYVDPPRGSEGERTRVTPGDVLVSITALIGAVAVVSGDLPEAFVNQHLALIRLSTSEVDSRWIAYCVMSPVGQMQFAADLYGGTKDGLGLDDIRSLVVLAPPFREQERIVAYLDSQSAKLMKLVQAVRTAINHLKELRTALISAAVTGKIDVQEAMPG